MKSYVFGKPKSWLIAWAKLASSLVGIFTLGFFIPNWDTDLVAYFLLEYVRNYKGEK